MRLRLRTKLLLSLALISSGLTCATLWMVRRSVRIQLRNEIAEDLRNSVAVFGNVQRQREVGLTRSAELLGKCFRSNTVQLGDHHLGAFLGEPLRVGLADAVAAARDDGDAPFESFHGLSQAWRPIP